ncbi:MAG: Type II secretion system protein F [Chlamydiae bacterium]|nr:Type II secretion system protein F [Chlamydiota bacterium]
MPIFRYRALTETGKKISGVIDADSFELAKEKLRIDKVLVTKLSTLSEKKEVTLSSQRLLAFTREIGQLLEAGLPLYESLLTIEEKYRRSRSHSLFLDLCDRLKSGYQLSEALKKYPKSFDEIYISMVRTGEQTGSLTWVFQQLHELIKRRQKLGKQLISAMAYPAFLGAFCFFIVIALLLFVIPSMRELFEGRELHPLTEVVLRLSRFLETGLIPSLLTAGVLITGVIYFFKREGGRLLLSRALQKVPLVKTILMQAALIRFCRSTSILLFGGVPLHTALSISQKVVKNPLLEEAVKEAEREIVEGKPLSELLHRSRHIPPLVTRMLFIAEETGKMPEILQSLSDIYDDELDSSLTHITTFIQPVLLLIVGGIVGLVVLSILLPLTDVGSLITT